MPNWWAPPQNQEQALPWMAAGQTLSNLGNMWANPGQPFNAMQGLAPLMAVKQQLSEDKKKQAVIDAMTGIDPNVKAAMGVAPDAALTAYIKNATEQQNAKDMYYSTPGGLYHPGGGIMPGTEPRPMALQLKNMQSGGDVVSGTFDPASGGFAPLGAGPKWNPDVVHGGAGAGGGGSQLGKGIVQFQNPDGSVTYMTREQALGQTTAPGTKSVPSLPQLTPKQQGELSSIAEQQATIGSIVNDVKSDPAAFDQNKGLTLSAAGSLGEAPRAIAERQLFTPEQIQKRSTLFNQMNSTIHERAGAAQTESEKRDLRKFLPGEADGPEQLIAKMNGFQNYLAKHQGAIKPVSKLAPQPMATMPSAPPQIPGPQAAPSPAAPQKKRIKIDASGNIVQ